MTFLLSCDPGVHRCAYALFENGALRLTYLVPPNHKATEPAPDVLAIEIPQVYGGPRQQDPNDLIQLAFAAGQFVQANRSPLTKLVQYKPREWKGQVKKHIHHDRIWQRLGIFERVVLPAETESRIRAAVDHRKAYEWSGHNLLDAVGIGLFYLGRMGQ